MKKTKIFTLTLLAALLATGCTKSEQDEVAVTASQNTKSRLWIFANEIGHSGSKVSINPNDPTEDAQWIEDELVSLNGTIYKVAFDNERGQYFLKDLTTDAPIQAFPENMSSLYPGASFGSNVVSIENNGKEIVLQQLEIGFLEDDRQSMAFPMVAGATANSTELYFDHLSAGVQLTLSNTHEAINIDRLTVIVQSNQDVVNLGLDDTIARWAVEGPWLPLGPVGHNDDEVDVKFSSVMNFVLTDRVNDTPYKTIEQNGELKFCVPITISSMKRLKVIGYDDHGDIAFYVTKNFYTSTDEEVAVEINRMYAFPTIEIGRGTK